MNYSAFKESISTVPDFVLNEGKYRTRFAKTEEDLDRVFRLRFEIFNLELKEGLRSSFATGRDIDEYDPQFHHLMVEDEETGEIVGTYRMQTNRMAREGIGYYTEQQYDLSSLPASVLKKTVEIGRACVAQKFRNGKVLFCLWRGFTRYTLHMNSSCLTGCASFTGNDARVAKSAEEFFKQHDRIDPTYVLKVKEKYFIDYENYDAESFEKSDIPRLILAYIKYGVRICGPPSIDRAFNTIDFPLFLDMDTLSERVKKIYFKS